MANNLSLRRVNGFVLIEALIALLIVSLGALAISKLEALTISAAGEARSRSEAMAISQKKLDELRNWVLETNFTSGVVSGGPQTVAGTNATYTFIWTVTSSSSGRTINLTTYWKDRFGTGKCQDPNTPVANVFDHQCVDLNTLITWDSPYNQLKGQAGFSGLSAPSPSGQAKRGTTNYGNSVPAGATTNTDGSGTKTYVRSDNVTELIDSSGKVVLYLDPDHSGNAQKFVTISGNVYFDQNASPSNSIPNSQYVAVRLSSEGQCFYNNTSLGSTIHSGTNDYKAFSYVCYVGPEWWGNVGITVDDSVNGQAASPTICVGDPTFNSGISDGTLISSHAQEASVRSYRGFYDLGVNASPRYLTTGMQGSSDYPYDSTAYSTTAPNCKNSVSDTNLGNCGKPRPSDYPSYYTVTTGDATDHFNQHFLITHLQNSDSCKSKMQGGTFDRNSGQYFCIAPDADTAHADACPSTWPGFTVGNSGQLSYTLNFSKTGSGTGTVSSSPTGITCGTGCTSTSAGFASGTSVTLTASPASGSVFAGWGGDCSGTGSCVVTMAQAHNVTATFNTGTTTYDLTASVTGSGTITSNPGSINCPTTCTDTYTSGTSVTLTAAAGFGYTFTGWGGSCSGVSASCTVTMDQARAASATFAIAVTPYTLTLAKTSTVTGHAAQSGTVSSSPSGITCGTSCTSTSGSFASGTVVTLTATPASSTYVFIGWNGGGCSGTGSCIVTMSANQSVTAEFSEYCTGQVKGSAHDKYGTISIVTSGVTGSCSMQGGSKNYTCDNMNAVKGTNFVLNNSSSSPSPYSYDHIVTNWACANITNENFP